MAAADLENTNWKLASYFDGAALHDLPSSAEVTLTFQDGAAGGKSACNRYRCDATIGDGTLMFGMAMGTRMACPPPLMEIEGYIPADARIGGHLAHQRRHAGATR